MADANGSTELSGSVMFFQRPEPLNAERHGALGLRRSDAPLAFASKAHVVPITVGEFSSAALSYPIIFAGDSKTPLAVMGLRQGQNLFIGDDGKLDAEKYLPAFVRRYPFVLAENKDQEGFIVCIDAASDLVTDTPDVPFFKDGKTSDFTNDAVEFLKNYETQRQLTERLGGVLKELDLYETKTVRYKPNADDNAEPVQLAEYFAISMEKLNALPADKLLELRDNGALNAIYVHNLSLMHWRTIIERAMRVPAPASPNPANAS